MSKVNTTKNTHIYKNFRNYKKTSKRFPVKDNAVVEKQEITKEQIKKTENK